MDIFKILDNAEKQAQRELKYKDKIIQKLAELLVESDRCVFIKDRECLLYDECFNSCFIAWAKEQVKKNEKPDVFPGVIEGLNL